jgi:hypothetical protein
MFDWLTEILDKPLAALTLWDIAKVLGAAWAVLVIGAVIND